MLIIPRDIPLNQMMNIQENHSLHSLGLGILISALTSLKNHDGTMKLASIGETMEGILVMTKLNTIFDTYETAEGAAQSF